MGRAPAKRISLKKDIPEKQNVSWEPGGSQKLGRAPANLEKQQLQLERRSAEGHSYFTEKM